MGGVAVVAAVAVAGRRMATVFRLLAVAAVRTGRRRRALEEAAVTACSLAEVGLAG